MTYIVKKIVCQNVSELSFQDALAGFTMDLLHLDGHKVTVSRDKVTWAGARVRKKGEGMPNFENNNLHGNLYITFDIEFPKQDFSDEDKEGMNVFSVCTNVLRIRIVMLVCKKSYL